MSGIKLYGAALLIILISIFAISSDSSANLDINSISSEEFNNAKYNPTGFTPALMEYTANKTTEIWSANNPSLYVTPEDDIVQDYAKQLKPVKVNESIYIMQNEDGAPLRLNYVKDIEQFGAEDYWINPPYYLAHEYNGKTLSGDCEDAALAMTSILTAKGYHSVAILGYVKRSDGTSGRHAWAETIIEDKVYIVDGSILYEKGYFQTTHEWTPRYMWNDVIAFGDYSPEWIKLN